jgi:hypothetical protein
MILLPLLSSGLWLIPAHLFVVALTFPITFLAVCFSGRELLTAYWVML